MPIATPEAYAEMLDTAKAQSFAYPAINVTSSQTLNAVIRGFAEAESDGIVQVSTGGAEYLSGQGVKDMVTGAAALAGKVVANADETGRHAGIQGAVVIDADLGKTVGRNDQTIGECRGRHGHSRAEQSGHDRNFAHIEPHPKRYGSRRSCNLVKCRAI